jgi:hypothetical protein
MYWYCTYKLNPLSCFLFCRSGFSNCRVTWNLHTIPYLKYVLIPFHERSGYSNYLSNCIITDQKHHQGDLFTFEQISETEPIGSKSVHQTHMNANLINTSLI